MGMMRVKKCDNEDCIPVCDACIYFRIVPRYEGEYEGDGFCDRHMMPQDAHEMCDEFYCMIKYREDGWQ